MEMTLNLLPVIKRVNKALLLILIERFIQFVIFVVAIIIQIGLMTM